MKTLKISLLFVLSLASACGPKSRDLTTDSGTMTEGDRLAKDEFYEEARKQYQRIKTEFPKSGLHAEADLKIASTYYNEENYATAATSYEDFLKMYPGRPEVPEAVFKLGKSYANQMPSTPQRDTRVTQRTVDAFTRLLVEFPNSEHSKEAEKTIQEARDQLATKIYEIARYYERFDYNGAAAKRYGELVAAYPDHPLAEESFARRVRVLRRDKRDDEANEVARQFETKYPKSSFSSYLK